MRILALAAVVIAASALLAGTASAHTVAIGTHNAGSPGSVTIWMGSYHTGSSREGSLTLGGTTKSFVSDGFSQASQPSMLTVGTNLFWYTPGGSTGQYTTPSNIYGVTNWQGVTFTGLSAGTHTYTISGMSTVVWADANSSRANWTGSLFIPGSSVNPVPEPGSLALLGLGLAGLGFGAHRRRRARANA